MNKKEFIFTFLLICVAFSVGLIISYESLVALEILLVIVLFFFTFYDIELTFYLFLIVSVLQLEPTPSFRGFTIQNTIIVFIIVSLIAQSFKPNQFTSSVFFFKKVRVWILLIFVVLVWTLGFPSLGILTMNDRLIEFKRLLMFPLTYMVALVIPIRPNSIKRCIFITYLLSLAVAIWAIFGYKEAVISVGPGWGQSQMESAKYWVGSAIGPILTMGAVLAIVEIALCSNYKRWRIIWRILIVIICAVTILITFERAMLILFIISIFAAILLIPMKRKVSSIALIVITFTILTYAVSSTFIWEELSSRWMSIFGASQFADIKYQSSARFDFFWPLTIDKISQSFPYGIGYFNAGGIGIFTHNQYLSWVLEFGLAGAIVFALLLIQIFREMKIHLKSNDKLIKSIALSLLATFLGMLVYLTFNDYFFFSWLYIFLALLGLIGNRMFSDYRDRKITLNNQYRR